MNTEKIESYSIDKNNLDDSEFNPVLDNDVNAEVTPNHGTVKVGKQVFAVELHWELTTSLAKAKQEARKRACEPHFSADFCCVRRGTTQQFALGFKTSGHRLKMPPLAANMADNIGGNWLGLFNVSNGYYVLGVKDDGILAETDRYFNDKQTALDLFQQLNKLMEWDSIYAPIELQISDAIDLDVTDCISKRPNVRLEYTKGHRSLLNITAGSLGITLIVIAAAIYFNTPFSNFDLLTGKIEQLKESTIQKSGISLKSNEIPQMPWINQFQGVSVLTGCVQSISEFPASVPGWTITELICNGKIASARMNRAGKLGESGGSINWIIPHLRKPNFDPILVLPNEGSNDLIEVNWITQKYPLIEADLETSSVQNIRHLLLKAFEERMTPITFTHADSNEYWLGMGLQFTSQFNPLNFVDILSLVPGLIITTVHYEPNLGNWTIKGKAYEKLSTHDSNIH